LQSRCRAPSFLLIVVGVSALWGLRYYLAILMGAVVTVGLLWGKSQGTAKAEPIRIMLRQGSVAIAFAVLMFSVGFVERSESLLVENDSGVVVQLDRNRQWMATAATSGYLPDTRFSTPGDVVEFFPVGLLYFLFVPFPWQFGSFRQNAVIPE